MPKASLRAALFAGAAFIALQAGSAFAQETAPATPAPDATQPQAAQPGVTQTQADPNQVVARVNGKDVTRQQVIDSAADLPPEIHAQIDMLFPQLLERYITITLLSEKGRSEGLDKDPEVQRRATDYENELIGKTYFSRVLEQRLTPDAVKARYEQWVKENPAQEEVHARHILVATEGEARALIDQLGKGGDFAALAKEKSTDKGSGAQGGDLGWFTKDVMVKEFADAAFAMQPGEVSAAPVKSQFGFHVIKLEERRPQAVPSFEEKKAELESDLAMQIQQSVVEELRKGAKVEKLGPDGQPLPEAAPQ
jgi:peptidyl-prolyl cis-trans isomerase C